MAAQTNDSGGDFNNLSRKLASLAYVKSKNDRILLENLLEDFNLLNYSNSITIVKEKAVLVINQCCFLVSHDEKQLVKKVLQLFHNLLMKLNISVEGKTLTVAIAWVLESLKIKEHIALALVVLQALIHGKGAIICEVADKILEMLKSLMGEFVNEEPPQTFLSSLNCVEALTNKEGAEKLDIPDSLVKKCCDVFLEFLYDKKIIKNDIWDCKCRITCIRGLGNIIDIDESQLAPFLPQIFGVIKGYMFYGIPGQDDFIIEKVVPSNIALPDELKNPTYLKKATGKYDKKSKKKNLTPLHNVANEDDESSLNSYVGTLEKNVFNLAVTSDSDFSDCENGASTKLKTLQTKVRRCSLILLGSILVKGDSKNLKRYIPSFLPDDSKNPHARNLIASLLKDPSSSCRSEVLIVLSIILTKFKRFFTLADSLSNSSFTSMSNYIGHMLFELHSGLTLALKRENYKIVNTHILKTISDLIRCSPYHKLPPGILTGLTSQVVPALKKKDVNIQIAALVVFGCVTSVDPKVDEVRNIIFENFEDKNSIELNRKSWLFYQCTKLLEDPLGCNSAVAVESLQVLAALVRNFPFETVICFPDDVLTVLEFTSTQYDFLVRLYAAKFLEATVIALQASVTCEDDSKRASIGLVASVWNKIIFGPIASLIQCEDHQALRAAGCDCLANVAISKDSFEASLIYDELPRSHQITCITHIFGCIKDESGQVRSSSVRALAVFVQFAALRQDVLFFLDAIDAFFTVAKDDNLSVRVQASWLFGHLAEASVANRTEGEDNLQDSMLLRLLDAGAILSQDAKKGKPYVVRGLANFLTLASADLVTSHRDKISRTITCLIENASSGTFMKARWNACYALGNVMSNSTVGSEVRSKAFPVLFELVQNYKNFKVRISAAHALASLPDREAYGDLYSPTWWALLSGLENAETMTDFNEYQHRDHLVDEICSVMYHLVSIITPADLPPLQDLLLHHIEPLSHQFTRFKNRIVPEKGDMIACADIKLTQLIVSDILNRDQKNALSIICGIFLSDPNR